MSYENAKKQAEAVKFLMEQQKQRIENAVKKAESFLAEMQTEIDLVFQCVRVLPENLVCDLFKRWCPSECYPTKDGVRISLWWTEGKYVASLSVASNRLQFLKDFKVRYHDGDNSPKKFLDFFEQVNDVFESAKTHITNQFALWFAEKVTEYI